MTRRVLLADDEPLIRIGLRAVIDAEPDLEVVAEADDGAAVLPLVRMSAPDVVLMDIRMPLVDGIQATRQILATVPHPPKILVVTTFESDENVYAALRAGAQGFVLKRARPQEIVGAIRVVADGDSLLFPAAIRALAGRFGGGATGAPLAEAGLTQREADVLRLMARGRSNTEIAGELFVGVQTVKTHVGNILTKLAARDRTQAVIAAYESGFV
ncbi:response regulator transcription factor [Virgisporangium aurantiacum]|uniref:DNA-binding response regulator n=1 Tax=Virgisporangium aurantiacum TaxID=175570 RepID=A0A8J3Z7D8_9ACTN|nr:response regulator transcription factor [Virgisporangium aurantiacum]GIJ56601.1 DNA-binding response regulator [Virgisporangium aurantiacum]